MKIALLTVEKLKVEVAYLRRMKYGRSSEHLEHAQLELVGDQNAQPALTQTQAEGAGAEDCECWRRPETEPVGQFYIGANSQPLSTWVGGQRRTWNLLQRG
ncbi:transposase domain-containing protein [Variovorax sp. LT1R16]|uniref:transposase domain-containing protein n=1 Tax=Variovorax sp. LT1R16 TaxID=3443728 RepID=UPI003F471903